LHPSETTTEQPVLSGADKIVASENNIAESRKRKASPKADDEKVDQPLKRQRSSDSPTSTLAKPECLYKALPPAPSGTFSLFLKEDFRDYICRCSSCFSNVSKHPYLMEEEEAYEPPLSSEGGDDAPGSIGSRSLLDRGEAALSNVDRVRAIEGVMVYNHLKDKVKDFLKPFAESGQPVGAEDIKKYFESLRGDAEAIKTAAAKSNGDGGDGDNRKEQSGKSLRVEVMKTCNSH
jgi:E3 ubiquitin-protein ligase UBR7